MSVYDRRAAASLTAVLLLAGIAATVASAEAQTPNWTQVKCERYRAAWAEALRRRGRGGLGPDFVARHEAFLASGCTAQADVCPRSAEEFELADVLTIAAMNAGTASTFLPFACRG